MDEKESLESGSSKLKAREVILPQASLSVSIIGRNHTKHVQATTCHADRFLLVLTSRYPSNTFTFTFTFTDLTAEHSASPFTSSLVSELTFEEFYEKSHGDLTEYSDFDYGDLVARLLVVTFISKQSNPIS